MVAREQLEGGPSAPGAAVSEIVRTWPENRPFTVEAALETRPELAERRSILIDLAYEEFCRLEEAGRRQPRSEFAARFPDIQRSLTRVLELHDFCWNEPEIRTALVEQPWPAIGCNFLGFRLVMEIGRGAKSRVYLARDLELAERVVIVKVGCDSREAHTLGALEHPGIVPVLSARTDPVTKLTVLCMPFLGYGTLDAVIDSLYRNGPPRTGCELHTAIVEASQLPEGKLPPVSKCFAAAVAQTGADLAHALAHAHAANVVHSDIKPSNVLIGPSGPMLLDFNLAQNSATDADVVGGTLPYMSPEHLLALTDYAHAVGPPADIFSLGVTLYEFFTGFTPFDVSQWRDMASAAAWLQAAHSQGPKAVTPLTGRVSQQLDQVIRDCLRVDPVSRPTAAELARRLAGIAGTVKLASNWQRTGWIPLVLGVGAVSAAIVPTKAYLFKDSKPLSQVSAGYLESETLSASEATQLLVRGWDRLLKEDLDAAHEDLERAHHVLQTSHSAAALGYSALRWKKDVPQAVPLFQEALKLGLDTAEVHNNFGYCCAQLGDLQTAQVHLLRSLELQPGLRAALHNLALVNLRTALRASSPPDMKYILAALDGDPCPDDLALDAACIFAYACATGEDKEQHLYRCRRCLETAIESGADPRHLKRVSSFWPDIEQEAWWQELPSRPSKAAVLRNSTSSRIALPFLSSAVLASGE